MRWGGLDEWVCGDGFLPGPWQKCRGEKLMASDRPDNVPDPVDTMRQMGRVVAEVVAEGWTPLVLVCLSPADESVVIPCDCRLSMNEVQIILRRLGASAAKPMQEYQTAASPVVSPRKNEEVH